MRLIVAGSPAAAVPSLDALADSDHEIAAVITRTPSRQGRAKTLHRTPVAQAADARGLDVLEHDRLDDAVTAQVRELAPDLGVIVAYGGLVREPLLSLPRLGWINLHFSLLPAWRGAAPVQRALMAGDTVTGVSVFHLVPALDAGDLIASEPVAVMPDETAGALLTRLSQLGAATLVRAVDALAEGTASRTPQTGQVSLAPKLSLVDGFVSFRESATRTLDRVRGTTPEPGAWALLDGQRVKLLQVHATEASETLGDDAALAPGEARLIRGRALVGTARGTLDVERVQPAGKHAMAANDWLRGRGGAAHFAEAIDGVPNPHPSAVHPAAEHAPTHRESTS